MSKNLQINKNSYIATKIAQKHPKNRPKPPDWRDGGFLDLDNSLFAKLLLLVMKKTLKNP